MIFLSHNSSDKPVVEPVAIRLREIYGQEEVFYDAWSIQPGDGIIDKMNDGLSAPDFVFVFVSQNSLKSNMVKLEWQNALFKATMGKCKIVPVRVDNTEMPAVLTQTLYIDMYSHGIETAIHHIVSTIQGTNTFAPAHMEFNNLTWSFSGDLNSEIKITVRASHLMEPNPFFAVVADNKNEDVNVKLTGGSPSIGGFNEGIMLNGVKTNAWAIAPMGGAITPKIPLEISVVSNNGERIVLRAVMHKTSLDRYTSIPFKPE